MKKWLSFISVSMLMTLLLSACGTSSDSVSRTNKEKNKEEKKVLVMGTSADYPPFEYIDTAKGEEIIGFDIDLVKAIADELGYEVKIQDMDFSGLIPAMQAGKVDFVMAGMSPTPEREKSADFSIPYYAADQVLVTKKDSGIHTLEDLNGKTIGVVVGSIQEGKAQELQKNIDMNVENRNRIPELVQEIKSDRFDAIIVEKPVAKGFLEANKELVSVQIPNEDTKGAGIVFPKGSDLTQQFNPILEKMKENGELEKLIIKWFGDGQTTE